MQFNGLICMYWWGSQGEPHSYYSWQENAMQLWMYVHARAAIEYTVDVFMHTQYAHTHARIAIQ